MSAVLGEGGSGRPGRCLTKAKSKKGRRMIKMADGEEGENCFSFGIKAVWMGVLGNWSGKYDICA